MLNLRTVDTFTMSVDFNSVRGYNDVETTVGSRIGEPQSGI